MKFSDSSFVALKGLGFDIQPYFLVFPNKNAPEIQTLTLKISGDGQPLRATTNSSRLPYHKQRGMYQVWPLLTEGKTERGCCRVEPVVAGVSRLNRGFNRVLGNQREQHGYGDSFADVEQLLEECAVQFGGYQFVTEACVTRLGVPVDFRGDRNDRDGYIGLGTGKCKNIQYGKHRVVYVLLATVGIRYNMTYRVFSHSRTARDPRGIQTAQVIRKETRTSGNEQKPPTSSHFSVVEHASRIWVLPSNNRIFESGELLTLSPSIFPLRVETMHRQELKIDSGCQSFPAFLLV